MSEAKSAGDGSGVVWQIREIDNAALTDIQTAQGSLGHAAERMCGSRLRRGEALKGVKLASRDGRAVKFRELRRAQDGRLQGEVEWARLATASEVRRAMRAGEAQTPADEAKAFRDCARQRAIEEIGTPGVRAGLFSSFTGTVAVGLATYAALLVWEVSQGADIAQSLEAFGGGALVVGIAVALNVAATASRKERVRERVERLCADPHGDGTAADIADCARNVAFARALGEDGDIRGFGGDYDLRGEGLRVVIVPDQFGAKANHVRVASETPLVVDAIDLDAFSDGYTRTPSNTRNLHHNTVVMDL